jgi:hypothetical protein
MAVLSRASTGLILQESFATLNAWQSEGGWSAVSDPALIAFDPTPQPLISPGAPGSNEDYNLRQFLIFAENGLWTALYDSGPVGAPITSPLVGQHMAISSDRGATWTRLGVLPFNSQQGGGVTAVINAATGYLTKFSGLYYVYRVTTPTSLNSGPFYGDVWSAPSLSGPWTWRGYLYPTTGPTWTAGQILPGGVFFDGAFYHCFMEGAPDGGGNYQVGIGHARTPYGPWSLDQAPIMSRTTLGDNRNPENPKIFYHPGLGRYCLTANLINAAGTLTDQNALALSTSVTNWSAATVRRIQHVCPLDAFANAGFGAVGVMSPLIAPDSAIVLGDGGRVPVTYDTASTDAGSNYAYYRKGYGAVLEPSATCARYTATTDPALRSLVRPLAHTDLVVEYAVEVRSWGTQGEIGFGFRRQMGTDTYRLVLTASGLQVQKRVGGTITVLPPGSGVGATEAGAAGVVHRVRLDLAGSSIRATLNGELQINATDSTFPSGVNIALSARAVNADVRLLSVRKSRTVTVNGVVAGQRVTARAAGGFVMASAVASGASVSLSVPHAPFDAIGVDTTDYPVPGGIWGGDTFLVASALQAIPARRRRR